MNKIFLSGNLTRDFDVKFSSAGKAYAHSGLAVQRFAGKDVDFFNIVAFGKTAEFCNKFLEKGRRVIIEGKLQTSSYADEYGNKRTDFSVIVDNIEFADSKKKDSSELTEKPPASVDDDLDLPF